MHSSIARYMPASREDTETIKRAGGQDQGVLVISPDDERLDTIERSIISRIGGAFIW